MLKNGPGDPRWGWKMLMHDLRNPPQPEQPITQQQPIQQQPQSQPNAPPQNISNIVNYPPMQNVPTQLKRFRFASVFTIVLTVTLLVIAAVLLWRLGVFAYLVQMFHNLMGM